MKIEKTWITKAGYQATVKIMPQGHRCGYVTLPDGHPCVGSCYDDLLVQVHGGLTYGDGATFGFDCAHYCDKPDLKLMSEDYRKIHERYGTAFYLDIATVKTLGFCIEQCENMAAQFKVMEVAGKAFKEQK